MLRTLFRTNSLRWLSFLNLFFLTLIGMTVILILLLSSQSYDEPMPPMQKNDKIQLPKNPFAQPEESYQEIGNGPLALKWVPPEMQLPDLRKELVFYGKNGRPDLQSGKQLFHIVLKGNGESRTLEIDKPIYLVYQGSMQGLRVKNSHPSATPLWNDTSSAPKGAYSFSPGNQPTPLWFEIISGNDENLTISIGMLDDRGTLVNTPADLKEFSLRFEESTRFQPTPWEIGNFRVDTTLLVRQKARWIGADLFLEKHGGDEFSMTVGKQRIDFFDGENSYACFVQAGDFLLWKNDHWCSPSPNEETFGYPLLSVKKIDDKIMNFELWDKDGKHKVILNLIRTRDFENIPDLTNEFKFVGAKTWAQFIVECRGERLILKPHDWLVLTKDGWHKISSPEEVDDFVDQKIQGPLFILDKMVKQNGRQVLVGSLYNASRTEMQTVELPSTQSTSLVQHYLPPSMALPPPLKTEAVQELKGE